ncbi:MAG: hypothetical protein GY802_08075 [Gammaproteobacteria bacterium]|nr:hypothetical protein [Gammaproteobacteria bacterium]
MEQLLDRPEFQSAIFPFILALLLYSGLRKITATAWIWALFGAFLVSSGLINGITITPLTGTRKIILLVLASLILAGLLPYLIRQLKLQRFATPVLTILALLWVFGKVVARMDITGIVLFLAGGTGLVLSLLWMFDRIANDDARFHGAGFSLLLGTGLSATAAASALLGQLALSLAAASGGVLLAWVLLGRVAGSTRVNASIATLPYVLSAALIGLAAVIFARLPWYALIPLSAIPFATSLVPVKSDARFLNALLNSLPGLFIALAVSFWVWQAGSSNSSGY